MLIWEGEEERLDFSVGAKKVESSEEAAEISEEEGAGEWSGERWCSGVRSCCLGGGVVKPGAVGEAGRE